jgi:hypothetical protein
MAVGALDPTAGYTDPAMTGGATPESSQAFYDMILKQKEAERRVANQRKREETLRKMLETPPPTTVGGGSVNLNVAGRNLQQLGPVRANVAGAIGQGVQGVMADRAGQEADAAEAQMGADSQKVMESTTGNDPETIRLMRGAQLGIPGFKEALIKRMAPTDRKKSDLELYTSMTPEERKLADHWKEIGGTPSQWQTYLNGTPEQRAAIEKLMEITHPPKAAKVEKDGLVNVFDKDGNIKTVKESEVIPGGYTKADQAAVAEKKRRDAEENVDRARGGVSTLLAQMEETYKNLEKQGETVKTENTPAKNILNYIFGTSAGQIATGAVGTTGQRYRDRLKNMRPLLINEIRKATGMTSKAMDSNRELQFYLEAATDPTRNLESNLEALRMLDQMYGLGMKELIGGGSGGASTTGGPKPAHEMSDAELDAEIAAEEARNANPQ